MTIEEMDALIEREAQAKLDWEDERNHDIHVMNGENHWFTCPFCDDEEVEEDEE